MFRIGARIQCVSFDQARMIVTNMGKGGEVHGKESPGGEEIRYVKVVKILDQNVAIQIEKEFNLLCHCRRSCVTLRQV